MKFYLVEREQLEVEDGTAVIVASSIEEAKLMVTQLRGDLTL